MKSIGESSARRAAWSLMALTLAACGGGTGNERDSGAQQTTLSVAASDADGDALSYEWRATAGTIDNRNAATTVWTLPGAVPGLFSSRPSDSSTMARRPWRCLRNDIES